VKRPIVAAALIVLQACAVYAGDGYCSADIAVMIEEHGGPSHIGTLINYYEGARRIEFYKGVSELVLFLIPALIGLYALWRGRCEQRKTYIRNLLRKKAGDFDDSDDSSWLKHNFWFLVAAFMGILAVIALMPLISDGIPRMLSPETYAINSICNTNAQ